VFFFNRDKSTPTTVEKCDIAAAAAVTRLTEMSRKAIYQWISLSVSGLYVSSRLTASLTAYGISVLQADSERVTADKLRELSRFQKGD
jgi:2-methylcitrate dehydratase PrpD